MSEKKCGHCRHPEEMHGFGGRRPCKAWTCTCPMYLEPNESWTSTDPRLPRSADQPDDDTEEPTP